MTSLLLPLTATIVLAISTTWCYLRRRSWLSPDVAVGVTWTIAAALSTLVGFTYYYSYAIALPVLCIVCFQVGACLIRTEPMIRQRYDRLEPQVAKTMLLIGVICACCGPLLHVESGDLSYDDYASDLGDAARTAAAQQYSSSDRMTGTAASKLCIAISSATFFLLGIYHWQIDRRQTLRWLIALTLPALVRTVLTTTRSAFLIPLMCYGAAWGAGAVLAQTERVIEWRRVWRQVAIVAPFLLFVVICAAFVRWNISTGDTLESIDKTRVWFGSSLSAFCVWHDDYYTPNPRNYANTFIQPLWVQLGISDFNTLENLVESYDLGYASHMGNSGTIFKPLIGQFGPVICPPVLLLAGFMCQLIYRQTARGSLMAGSLLASVFAMVLFSPNASFLNNGRHIISMVLFMGICGYSALLTRVLSRRKERGGTPSTAPISAERNYPVGVK